MTRSVAQSVKPLVPEPARRLLRRLQSLSWLPHTRRFDKLWALAEFLRVHRRMPRTGSWLLNDVLFRIRVHELEDPRRVCITDKENLRAFVSERAGDRFSVPVIAVLRSPEDAVAYDYPAECVVKPTHMSGQVIFARTGHPVDRERVKGWFGRNFYYAHREANYRTLTPKVVVEPYVFGRPYPDVPTDYRIFCVEGRPRLLLVEVDHATSLRRCYFDCEWGLQPFTTGFPRYGITPHRPANLDAMLALASSLSAGFSLLRVDLYSDGEQVLVGELTNYSGGGVTKYFPPEGEIMASKLLWPERWSKAMP